MKYSFVIFLHVLVLVTNACAQRLTIAANTEFSFLPKEIVGTKVDDIFAVNDTTIGFRSGGFVTTISGNSIFVESIPLQITVDDYAVDHTTGIHFLSCYGSVYTIDTYQQDINLFLSGDVGRLKITPIYGRLAYYKSGDHILSIATFSDSIKIDSYNLIEPIRCVEGVGKDILVSLGHKLVCISDDVIIPAAYLPEDVITLAPTASEWIFYSTENCIGIINSKGKCKVISDFGVQRLLFYMDYLVILFNDGRVGVVENVSNLIAAAAD